MTTVSSLSPTPMAETPTLATMIRVPGQEICPGKPAFARVETFVRLHLARLMAPKTRETAALYAVIDGPPGTGKTVAVTDACLRAGIAVCNVPASMLAGATENAATEALGEIMRGVVAYSRVTRNDVALVIDDFHQSIAGSTDARIGRTVNSALLVGELQRIADPPRPYRNASGKPVSILFTGNDFSQTAPSLFRDQRANRYTHEPTPNEKAQIIFDLMTPRSPEDMRIVEKLVKTYHRLPIAFWAALRNDLFAAHLARSLPDGPLNADTVNALMPARVPLNPTFVWTVAKERAAQKLANHYAH